MKLAKGQACGALERLTTLHPMPMPIGVASEKSSAQA
jgi:hypothetical protein